MQVFGTVLVTAAPPKCLIQGKTLFVVVVVVVVVLVVATVDLKCHNAHESLDTTKDVRISTGESQLI